MSIYFFSEGGKEDYNKSIEAYTYNINNKPYEDYNNTNNNLFIHNPNIYSQVYE